MKKFIYLIVLALILGLVLTGCSLLSNVGQVPTNEQSGIAYLTKGAGDKDSAVSFPLFAGKDLRVGDVLVWNDENEVCVKYQLSDTALEEGWLLYETHLAVATDLDKIPHTKKGNPIPGQFPYGNDELGGVEEDGLYCIPFGKEEGELDVGCDDDIVIAAHAVVRKPIYNEYERDPYADEVVELVRVDGIKYNTSADNGDNGEDILGAPRGVSGCVIQVGDPSGCWVSPGYIPGLWSGTEYVPDEFGNLDSCCSEEGDCPRAGHITVAFTDNKCNFAANPSEPSLYVYEVGGKTEGFLVEVLDENGDVIASYESLAQEEFNEAIPIYLNGTGTFSIVRLTSTNNGGGDPDSPNTSGPDFDAVECLCPVYEYQEETAWGGEIEFDGANWAKYFTYEIQCWELVDTITVPANKITFTSTNIDLVDGEQYKFVASGTCFWRTENHPSGYLADASYWLRNDFYIGWRDQYSLAMWDGDFVNIPWVGTYEGPNAHIYEYEYTADVDGPVQFIFTDDQYTDNSGDLKVEIYQWM